MSDFTVLTLNWNGKTVLPPMIASLAGPVEKLGGSLLVFDNASTDGSPEEAEETWGEFPWFSLVRSRENLGFAGGANAAIHDLVTEYVVLANSDTVFLPGSLEIIMQTVRSHPEYGVTGPKLLWPDGSLQRSLRDFPFPGALLREHLPFLRSRSAVRDPHENPRTVDWMVGAVMAFRREVFLGVGGFDEDFFFYHEETDLQYRLQKAGYPSFFIPSAEVIHVEGGSAVQKFGRETYTKYIRAKLMFLAKHGYRGSRTLFRALMWALQSCRLAAGLLFPPLRRRDVRYTFSYCRTAFRELCSGNGRENR